MKLKIILEPSEEGGYTVYVPSLPGCISEGDTREEAIKNIKEAIELYLEPVDEVHFIDYGGVIATVPAVRNPLADAREMLKGKTSLTEALLRSRKEDAEKGK